ncbi:hypothetical protein WD019_00795 [Fictibacillus sp. Mic-4]|uniref:hypothetical protein n=1 Tax=Fictibacillus TaxID=1329200 RepID=UPI000478D5ED|nr:hypothetical protein [Fictibacillus gelatini]
MSNYEDDWYDGDRRNEEVNVNDTVDVANDIYDRNSNRAIIRNSGNSYVNINIDIEDEIRNRNRSRSRRNRD